MPMHAVKVKFFFKLHAPSFTTYRDMGAVSKKNIIWPTILTQSDVIFEVPKCPKILSFRGSAPNPTRGAYWESFTLLLRPPSL